MFFGAIRTIVQKVDNLSPSIILEGLFSDPANSDRIKEFIKDLNRFSQLFEKGIDSEGIRLDVTGGDYSAFTVKIKERDGLPTDRITLFQTGAFYDTFQVSLESEGIVIEADTLKESEDLQDRWGENIIGLTDESISELIDFLQPLMVEWLNVYLTDDI